MARLYFVIRLFLIVGCLVVVRPVSAQEAVFLSTIDDLPLMPGLTEDVDAALSFETAAGRIVEITASGPATAEAVSDYYHHSLPQLGWQQQAESRYVREGEILVIEYFEADPKAAGIMVQFRLSPQAAK